MTAAPAHEPPFALDGTVTRDKVAELLGVQTELVWLDYKRECNLSDTGELVELVKDVGAMSIHGGYLLVGVDDNGVPLGVPTGQELMFDEATLRAKLARYLPAGFEVRTAVHDLDDGAGPKPVVVVWVAPHPDGWSVFTRNGDYTTAAGRPKVAFRAGEVYARHGTSSEPWNQGDIVAARVLLVAREKDAWRAEHAEETRRALASAASATAATASPATAYTWELDAEGFEAATVELIRRDDDIAVRRMLRTAALGAHTRLVVTGEGADAESAAADMKVLLDRITTLAALGLELRRPAYLTMAVQSLLGLYDMALVDPEVRSSQHRLVPVLWLRIAERLYALGALAVRLEDWEAVRLLALAPVPALQRESPPQTWHRDALTQSSRARLFNEQLPDGRTRELSLLLFARAVAAAEPALRPDLPGSVAEASQPEDPLLTSLCEFDLLVSVIAGTAAGAATERQLLRVSYPNFARADGSRANPVVARLVLEPAMREALVPKVDDLYLALVLQLVDRVAQREGQRFWGWEGYTDARVIGFIERHAPV